MFTSKLSQVHSQVKWPRVLATALTHTQCSTLVNILHMKRQVITAGVFLLSTIFCRRRHTFIRGGPTNSLLQILPQQVILPEAAFGSLITSLSYQTWKYLGLLSLHTLSELKGPATTLRIQNLARQFPDIFLLLGKRSCKAPAS